MSGSTNTIQAFGGTSFKHVPDINLPIGSNLAYMFSNSKLETVGILSKPVGLDMTGMFKDCTNLTCIKGIDTRATSDTPSPDGTADIFLNCTSLISPSSITNQGLIEDKSLWEDIYCLDGQEVGAPSAIPDFIASDLEIDVINISFTAATGTPAPTYDLCEVGVDIPLVTGISTSYAYATERASIDLYVKAVNVVASISSNTDIGTTKAPAGIVTITSSRSTSCT